MVLAPRDIIAHKALEYLYLVQAVPSQAQLHLLNPVAANNALQVNTVFHLDLQLHKALAKLVTIAQQVALFLIQLFITVKLANTVLRLHLLQMTVQLEHSKIKSNRVHV